MRFLLASASPRRAELLRAAGFDFDVQPAGADETLHSGESPDAYARRIAQTKAQTVAGTAAGRIVLAADTTVVAGGEVLGKPIDDADAARMLRLLAGRRHDVLTAVTVLAPGRTPLTRVETTAVELLALSDAEIAWYVGTGEPADKAGAYGIQGLASRFVNRIEGSYSNVVGLPISLVYTMLHEIDPAMRPGYPEGAQKPESPCI
jgi:septum formation protein